MRQSLTIGFAGGPNAASGERSKSVKVQFCTKPVENSKLTPFPWQLLNTQFSTSTTQTLSPWMHEL
jgi:hypothetical protein